MVTKASFLKVFLFFFLSCVWLFCVLSAALGLFLGPASGRFCTASDGSGSSGCGAWALGCMKDY